MIDGTQIFTALPSTDQEQLIAKLTEKVFANGAKIIEQARHPLGLRPARRRHLLQRSHDPQRAACAPGRRRAPRTPRSTSSRREQRR